MADAVAHHEAAFRDHYSVADDESVGDDVRRPHVYEVRHRHLAGHVQIAEHLHLASDGSASVRRKVIPDQVSDGVWRKRVQVALEALQDIVRLGAVDLDSVDEVEVTRASDEELVGLVVPRLRHGLLVAELERTPLVHWERMAGLRRLNPHRAERVSVEYAQLRIRLTRRHRLAFVHPPDDLDQVGAIDRRLAEEGGVVGDRRQFEVVRREARGRQHSQAEGRAVGGVGTADEAVVDRAAAVVRGAPGGVEDVSGRGGGGRPPGSSHAVRLPVEARLHGRFKGLAVALHRGLEVERLAAVGLELGHLGAGGLDRPAEGDGSGERGGEGDGDKGEDWEGVFHGLPWLWGPVPAERRDVGVVAERPHGVDVNDGYPEPHVVSPVSVYHLHLSFISTIGRTLDKYTYALWLPLILMKSFSNP